MQIRSIAERTPLRVRGVYLLIIYFSYMVTLPLASAMDAHTSSECNRNLAPAEQILTREEALSILSMLSSGDRRIGASVMQMVPQSSYKKQETMIQTFLKSAHTSGEHWMTISSVLTSTTDELGDPQFQNILKQAVDFVIKIYQERKEAWPSSFITKLQELAREFRNESTYIDIEATKDSKRSLIATIRLIREKYGLIPMERYLGFVLKKTSDQMKVEPGNYAIEKWAREIGSIETSIGIIAQTELYQSEFGKTPLYATYADKYSEELHLAMGMKYVTADMIYDLKAINSPYEIDSKTGAIRITKDGVVWTPMYATAPMFVDMLEKRFERIAEKRGGEIMKAAFQKIRQDLSSSMKGQERVFIGRLINAEPSNMSGRIGILKVTRNGPQTKFSISAAASYSLDSSMNHVSVPWPLADGYTSRRTTEYGHEEVQYSDGIVLVKQFSGSDVQVFAFQLDPSTNRVIRVQHMFIRERQVVQQYAVEF